MGLGSIVGMLFGGGNNKVKETIEVFRENAEASSARMSNLDAATLAQLTAEFARPQRGWFDSLVDGLNRLPRPLTVLGLVYILVLPTVDPVRAVKVFTALALIPSSLWTVIGVVVAFYFGGRMQLKGLEFNQSLAGVASQLPAVMERMEQVQLDAERFVDVEPDAGEVPENLSEPAVAASESLKDIAPYPDDATPLSADTGFSAQDALGVVGELPVNSDDNAAIGDFLAANASKSTAAKNS